MMQTKRANFVRSTAALLAVGLLALLAIVGTSLWLGERTQSYFDVVIQAREGQSATVDLRSYLQQAETGQRGYLLTLDESYLEPYEVARTQVGPTYERLRQVLIPFPRAQEGVRVLGEAITAKMDELAQTIALARGGRMDEAREIVLTNRGRDLMVQADTFLLALLKAADTRLNTGVIEQRESASALRWVSIFGALVIIAVVGGSAWTVFHYTRELAAARLEMEKLNQGLEERVQERTADLGRANEEIQRFAYIVTHDLRAPLVNIMGFTSELESSFETLRGYFQKQQKRQDQAGPSDEARPATLDMTAQGVDNEEARQAAMEDMPEAINFIRSSTRKMDGLINAILKLSREGRRTLKPEQIALSPLLEATSAAIQHQVSEAGGAVQFDINVPPIVSDRIALEQVFGNLLDNATKYSDPKRPLDLKITARTATANRIVVEVADNGRGIAKQDHERVFELFRRSGTQDKAGEGIGLAHVRALVRSLGGDITLTSELGQGTTFRISLPRDLRAVVGSKAA